MVLFDMNLLCKDKNTITLMLPLKSKKKKKGKKYRLALSLLRQLLGEQKFCICYCMHIQLL